MSREHQRRKEQLFGSGQADHVALHALLEQGKSGNATFEKKLNKNFSKMIQEMRERENITKKKKTKGKEEEQARESADSTTKVIDATTDSFTNVPKNEYETKKPHANESYATFTNRTMESLDAPATTEKPIHDLVETIRKSCPMEMLNSPPAKQGLIKIDLGMEQESFNDFSSMGRPSSFSERSKRNLEHERSLRPKRQKTSMVGPWNCERCTYYNETRTWLSATCEMCNMTRPTV